MPKQSKRAATAPGPDDSFSLMVRAFARDPLVTEGGRFGAKSLKVEGKVFAMLVKGKFVAKLPAARIAELLAELVEEGGAEPFDPGHGRRMKEWVSLSGHQDHWINLAKEARQFVCPAR